jgi:multidrug efflux system membrane fusion protein
MEVNPTKVAMATRSLDATASQVASGGLPKGNALTSAQD